MRMIDLVKRGLPTEEASRNQPLLVDASAAAELLSISKRTLWTMTNSREIPSVRIGRCVRYAVSDLQEFVEQLRRS